MVRSGSPPGPATSCSAAWARMPALFEGQCRDLTHKERREVAETAEWIEATLDGISTTDAAETPARVPNERRVCKRDKEARIQPDRGRMPGR